MTNRTRYFLVGSGLIVAVGLCTGLVAYYNGELPLTRSAVGPSELAYVPADATAVAFVDVRHIMASEFRQRLRTLVPAGDERHRLLAETGIDLERDIDTVVAGFSAAGEAGRHVVLIRGRFNREQVEALAMQHGSTVVEHGGKRIIVGPAAPVAGQANPDAPAFAFLEPGLVAFGHAGAITRAIDAAVTHNAVTQNAELMKFVADASTSSAAWVAGKFDAVGRHPALPAVMQDQLGTLQWFALGADVDRVLSCRVHARARDAKAGDEVRAVVNGALSAARLMAGSDARFDGALSSVQATGTGADIELSFTVPAELLDALPHAASRGAEGSQ